MPEYGVRIVPFTAVFCAIVLCAYAANDPVIEAARVAAADYARSLPDYIATRSTTRYSAKRAGSAAAMYSADLMRYSGMPATAWLPSDTVSATVASEHGTEVYSNIIVNGKPVDALPAGGIWSAGEFAGLQLGILATKNAAVFSHPRADKIHGIPVTRYDFAIDQHHSDWHLEVGARGKDAQKRFAAAFDGAIWIDPATGGVLRLERSAKDLPDSFPLDAVKSTTEYDYVEIGGSKFLLPTRAETITCAREAPTCYRNQTVFASYSKFEANSTIEFK